jgi:predicted CoA-binding protein
VAHHNPSDNEIAALLQSARTIAVVGASSNPMRSSHGVMAHLIQLGYTCIPVNPHEREVLGQKAYSSLAEVPGPIDIVDVFRRSEFTPGVADEAVKCHAKVLWLQQGLWNEEAAARATAGGLTVVMDECLGVVASVTRSRPLTS